MPTVAEILKEHPANGFRNRDLRKHVADLLDADPPEYHAGKMNYDLRRLRLKGIIARQPGTTRYFLTPYGYRVALFMTRLHARLFRPGFASLNPDPGVHVPHPLRRAMDKVNAEIDTLIERSHLKQKKAARSPTSPMPQTGATPLVRVLNPASSIALYDS